MLLMQKGLGADGRRMTIESQNKPFPSSPQFAVAGAGFCGGIIATAIYAVLFLDFVALLRSDLFAVVTVMGYALVFGLIGMFAGTILGLSTKLLLQRLRDSSHNWFVVTAVSFIIAFCLPFLAGGGGDFREQETRQFSWSIAEAKKKGTFVSEVEIVPNSLAFVGKKITFEEAWLERQPEGDYALCFRLDQGKEVFKGISAPFFVRDERKGSFQERHGRGWLQFIERLDSDDLSSVRASLITGWKEERPKDIRFVRKDKKAKKGDAS